MGRTEDRIAEFQANVKKAGTDRERARWEARLAHAKEALKAEKATPAPEPDAPTTSPDRPKQRNTRQARSER
jgi:hypothetical protein